MPDKVLPEEGFRDFMFTSRATNTMKTLHNKGELFMVAIGFKLPHLAVHIPYKYYQLYANYSERGIWKRPKRELKFPLSSPIVAHKCCALPTFTHMEQEGAVRSSRTTPIGSIHKGFTQQSYNELMVGYAAAVSFLDVQIGRLLDTIDELNLWDNITIVLTSDHGMHNGEKGIWLVSLFATCTHYSLGRNGHSLMNQLEFLFSFLIPLLPFKVKDIVTLLNSLTYFPLCWIFSISFQANLALLYLEWGHVVLLRERVSLLSFLELTQVTSLLQARR